MTISATKKLYDWMILENFEYVKRKIKAPLMRALISINGKISFISLFVQVFMMTLAIRRYPYPTHENCNNMNTHFLIDLQNEFLMRQTNMNRRALFNAIWRIFLCEYEHDISYKRPVDWLFKKIHDGIDENKLKLHLPDQNMIHWQND